MPDQKWRFREDDEANRVLEQWLKDLKERNRGDRAALRRAGDLSAAYFIPAYHNLYGKLAKLGWNKTEGVAAVAVVLAHLEPEGGGKHPSFGQQLAMPTEKGGKKARFSGLRFRRLLENPTLAEAVPALVRAVKMLKTCDPRSLADVAYHWNDQVRKELAFEYYEHAPREED